MNSSEDQSDKLSDSKKKKGQKEASSSAASSGDEENDDRNSIQLTNNSGTNNATSYGFRKNRKRLVWEVMEGYRDPNMKVSKPENYEGILLKRRNWPMKGWHKRFFMLADGILSYGKSKSDMTKNKVHGTVNTYLSIVSYISSSRRILIDFSTQSNTFVCHLKAKTPSDFDAWLDHLKKHRLYYQFRVSQGHSSSNQLIPRQSSISIQSNPNANNSITISSINLQKQISNEQSAYSASSNISNLDTINESSSMKKTQILDDKSLEQEFKKVEDNLINLSKTLALVATPPNTKSTTNNSIHFQNKPNNHHQQASCSSFEHFTASPENNLQIHVSKSNPNLINNELHLMTSSNITNNNNNNNNSNNKLNVNNLSALGNLVYTIANIDATPPLDSSLSNSNVPNFLITDSTTASCSSFSNYNNDDASRQYKFYQDAKSINDQLNVIYQQLLIKKQAVLAMQKESQMDSTLHRGQRSQSVMSSISVQDSQLQFYDAIEYFTSESESEENSEESDDGSGGANKSLTLHPPAQNMLTRRRKLPAPAPDTSQVSLWGILRKAIGKDLSKIALPVILNEPIGILQRLCEELEYTDLLETASTKQDPYDRMVYIAAFIISGYSSSYYRNGAKDFNPLLGETYELIRPDKGWKYISEQVSHHPPISATHCQSKTFTHEQIFHAKIKFWGRSMEVHPEGYTRVTLPKFDETYQWNKIVMYVSNLTGSQRRIEHIGEITVRCTNGITCTITFPKASYSSQKNEFYGDIIHDNIVKRKIFGQWHETFLCGTDNTAKTIWRMGAMPEDSNLYYGFTRFAIELNEFTENLKDELPATDSRFRPDQRLFENGKVDEAEIQKQKIEENQRNRRRELEAKGEEHQPLWFSLDKQKNSPQSNKDKDWIFNNQYWIMRENPGYKNLKHIFPNLW